MKMAQNRSPFYLLATTAIAALISCGADQKPKSVEPNSATPAIGVTEAPVINAETVDMESAPESTSMDALSAFKSQLTEIETICLKGALSIRTNRHPSLSDVQHGVQSYRNCFLPNETEE